MSAEPLRIASLSRPGEPTDAPPGSELKIRIMIERAGRREPLFHPLDGAHDGLPTDAGQPWWHIELADDSSDGPEIFTEEASPVIECAAPVLMENVVKIA